MKERIPRTVDELLTIPPVDWEKCFDTMPNALRGDAAGMLDAFAQRAAEMSGYASGRYGNGCGDQGHDNSVRLAHQVLKGVRRALGYTYPASGARVR